MQPSARPVQPRHVLIVALMCIGLLGTVGTAVPQTVETTLYAIGAEDVLSIVVWDEADLTGHFTVEGDGTLAFPMIGRVEAEGQTVLELEQTLQRRLKAGYLRNPQVSVTVETYGSRRVFVMGEVEQAGRYTMRGNMPVIEALALAGSTTQLAAGEAFIVRHGGGSAARAVLPEQASESDELLRVDLEALQRGELSQNVTLRSGDTLFVPRQPTVFVTGNVSEPGVYPISRGTTVGQVVILAGGATERGSASRLRVRRTVQGETHEYRADDDDPVRAGDTVVVLQRLF